MTESFAQFDHNRLRRYGYSGRILGYQLGSLLASNCFYMQSKMHNYYPELLDILFESYGQLSLHYRYFSL